MGLLDRMRTMVRSNLNDLIDRMQDPAKEIDLLVVEMDQQLRDGRQELIGASATEKRLAASEAQLAEEATTWERRAAMAVKAGDDALAHEALVKKQDVELHLAAVRRDRQQQAAYAGEMKQQLAKLEMRLKEIKGRQATIGAKARAARSGSGLGEGRAFEELDRMAGRVDDFEAQGEAEAELAMSGKEEDERVAAKFRDLEQGRGGAAVEDALAALKRKLEEK